MVIENETSQDTVYVYPTCTNTSITIVANLQKEQPVSIQMVNNTGQVMYNKTMLENSDIIDVSGLSTGLYYIRIEYGNKVQVQKVVVK